MGAKYKNQFAGTFGLIGTFSSYFSHHISTMEGGLLLTNNTELYHILLSLRSHGWTRHLPKHNKVTGVKSDVDFEESFKFVLPGYNLRPIEMMGSIGTVQLKKLPKFVHIRRKNANYFNKKFGSLSNIIIQKELGESSWFGFSIILKENFPVNRETVIDFLTKNNSKFDTKID